MNKEQAAAALGITVRTLQRHMAAHRIGFAMRKTATGEEATFSAEEVARFKAQRDALTETVTPAANVSEVVRAPAQALERQPGAEGMAILVSAIKDALQGEYAARKGQAGADSIADLSHKLMLSLPEAARLSGLSANHLREAIHEGKLKAKIVGRGWKVKPDELRAYVGKVLK
jgi:excisionase family DNA binding protein